MKEIGYIKETKKQKPLTTEEIINCLTYFLNIGGRTGGKTLLKRVCYELLTYKEFEKEIKCPINELRRALEKGYVWSVYIDEDGDRSLRQFWITDIVTVTAPRKRRFSFMLKTIHEDLPLSGYGEMWSNERDNSLLGKF